MSDIDYFSNTGNMETITPLSQGLNGTTYTVAYKDGKKALLKTPKNANNDNLMYEYLVGKDYINAKISSGNSIFVKTYALFKYEETPVVAPVVAPVVGNIWSRKKIKEVIKQVIECENVGVTLSTESIGFLTLLNKSNSTSFEYDDICKCNAKFALLIEYVDNSESLENYLKNIDYDMSKTLLILQKIYYSLNSLYPNFVHNDLTLENVLVTQTGEPKIIDYGRSYFKGTTNSSDHIYEIISGHCNLQDQFGDTTTKGEDNGFFEIWNPNKLLKNSTSFMNKDCQQECNDCRDTKDLILLYNLNYKYQHDDDLKKVLNKINPRVTRNYRDTSLLERYCEYEKDYSQSISSINEASKALNILLREKLIRSAPGAMPHPPPRGGKRKLTQRRRRNKKRKTQGRKRNRGVKN